MVSYPTTLAIFSAIVILGGKSFAQPVKYDQRQEGDLNVRTDIEDVVFIVVPPKDLISAGVGLVAATAAEFLKKNYGGLGLERWPSRTASKVGLVPMESAQQLKKISHVGDPNRYNFHDGKNPSKAALETSTGNHGSSTEAPKSGQTEKLETASTTENKTVKKDLKPDEEKAEEAKVEKTVVGHTKKSEATKTKTEATKAETSSGPLKLIGEDATAQEEPTSLLRVEGCGPDAYRNKNGMCVYKKPEDTTH